MEKFKDEINLVLKEHSPEHLSVSLSPEGMKKIIEFLNRFGNRFSKDISVHSDGEVVLKDVKNAVEGLLIDNIMRAANRNIDEYLERHRKGNGNFLEPVGDVFLEKYNKSFSRDASLAFGIVMEYIASELLHLSANYAISENREYRENPKYAITPKGIQIVIEGDPELEDLYKRLYTRKSNAKKSSSRKSSGKKTIAQKIKECREKGLVYDRETGKCRPSKRGGKKSTSRKSPAKKSSSRKSPAKKSRSRKSSGKKTIAQKIKECREKGLVYDKTTGKCRPSKRGGKKSTSRKSPSRKSKDCPPGTVRSPSGRCIKIGGAAYKKYFG